MSVFLQQNLDRILHPESKFQLNLAETNEGNKLRKPIPGIAERLERAFDNIAVTWWELGHKLGKDKAAYLSHTPSCSPNTSDLGLMLAWSLIVKDLAEDSASTLVVCNDPWLFRHLALIKGVTTGPAPRLWPTALKHSLRGWAARLKFTVTALKKLVILERGKNSLTTDKPALLVYSNPNSHPEGKDGYFGDLMKNQSQLTRILHVDGSLDRARHLSTGNRTSCLDAWGSFFEVLKLPLVRWKTPEQDSATPFKWLIRRALSKEGSTAQAAAIAWQVACQKRWLKKSRPSIVVWPWENHGWEREFVRQTRHLNIETLGYQHSVIGPQMLNYSSASNHDGQTSLPDHILCSGYATLNQLLNWGLPRNKLSIGGAFRIPIIKEQKSDPNAPIFLALPFDGRIAHQMIDAATLLIEKGYRFLVKDHPMTPYKFSESDELKRTDRPYHAIEKLSAVIYAATTVGLETAIAGLPTIRFLPEGLIGMNILPQEVILPAASAVNLASVLKNIIPPNLSRDDIFSPVPMDTWQKWLNK